MGAAWIRFGLLSAALAALLPGSAHADAPLVATANLDGEINSVTANYISAAADRASAAHADAFVVLTNTPGGLMSSMDEITTKLLNSPVPVIVYVSPAGARAASAGLFVAQSADLVAMAPSTNIGSAHPVLSTGAAPDDVLGQKVLNDAVARIRNYASIHGRNADWSEKAVRESVNIGADEAVRIHVADLEAKSLPALLQAVDGRTLKRPHGQDLRLRTSGAQVSDFSMSPWQQLLHALIDPNIAYLLMLLAVYGLIAEVTNPGAILPGVIGVISAILALVAFASLPVNLAGALLIVFAFLLFLADLKAPTHGVLTVGGLISLLLGSAFLVNPGPVGAGINPLLIAGATLATVIMFGIVLRKAIAARSQKVFTGAEGMIGSIGQAREKLDPTGTVFAAGALWRGMATQGPIEAGSTVRIVGRQGLTLEVTQLEPAAQPAVEKV